MRVTAEGVVLVSRATAENEPVSAMRTKVLRARSMSMIGAFYAKMAGRANGIKADGSVNGIDANGSGAAQRESRFATGEGGVVIGFEHTQASIRDTRRRPAHVRRPTDYTVPLRPVPPRRPDLAPPPVTAAPAAPAYSAGSRR